MRKLILSIVGASAIAISSAASAVVIIPGPNTPDGTGGTGIFVTSPNPVPVTWTGPITATIGHTGITGTLDGTSFQDIFRFTVPLSGLGGGSITTDLGLTAQMFGTTDLDISSVTVNGVNAIETLRDINGVICFTENVGTCGATETWALNNVAITGGALNEIIVTGISRGNGSYGGNIAFAPNTASVPEPATWAMMLLGFAGIGWQLRRKRSGAALSQFA
jgi:PEP-CTERM motif